MISARPSSCFLISVYPACIHDSFGAVPQAPASESLRSSNNSFLKRYHAVRTIPDLSGLRLCIAGSHPASTEVLPVYQELKMKYPWVRPFFLDLEFRERTLKTLTLSLQENAKYFTTRSYLTLTFNATLTSFISFSNS